MRLGRAVMTMLSPAMTGPDLAHDRTRVTENSHYVIRPSATAPFLA